MKEIILKNAMCKKGKRDESEEMKQESYGKEEEENLSYCWRTVEKNKNIYKLKTTENM